MHLLMRIGVCVVGVVLTVAIWRAALRSLVVARPVNSRLFFIWWIRLINWPIALITKRMPYPRRDRFLAPVAMVSMISLVPFWLCCFAVGYGLLFVGLGDLSFPLAMRESGSSLFTLGFSSPAGAGPTILAFAASITGPLLIALLISYLPTLYSAFNRRETEVSLLAGRGGDPVWAPQILLRYHWSGMLTALDQLYSDWERLMADIAESHTSYPVLVGIRSPNPNRSWITSMMAVMDAAALQLARTPSTAPAAARLVITGGVSTLESVSRALGMPVVQDPLPTDPIKLTYEEFVEGWALLDTLQFPEEVSCAEAWKDFRGWRVNWEPQAYQIAWQMHAPPLAWTGPRAGNPPIIQRNLIRNRRHDDVEGLNRPPRRPELPPT